MPIEAKAAIRRFNYGNTFTVVRNPADELKKGTLHAMCMQLGINQSDL
jgi:hypothetical protein